MRFFRFFPIAAIIAGLLACAPTPSPWEGLEAGAVFDMGNNEIAEGDYEDARGALNHLLTMKDAPYYYPLAQLRLADSYIESEDPETAAAEYRKFLEIYVGHKFAPYARYQIGMVYYGLIKDAERGYGAAKRALAEFETLKRDYPRNPYRLGLEQKMALCRKIIADYEYMVGDFYFRNDAFLGSQRRLEGLLQKSPGYAGEPEVLYRLSLANRELGNINASEAYAGMLLRQYPISEAAKMMREEIARLEEEKKDSGILSGVH